MKARATLLGHPIHAMLVVLPLGLWVSAVIFDVITMFRPTPALSIAAYWNIVAGCIGAAIAAVFGVIDWTKIPSRTRAKRIGVLHALINVGVIVFFVIAAGVRSDNVDHVATGGVLVLELLAFVMGGVSGWLGGELVNRLGIGVHEDAGPDAPSLLGHGKAPAAATPRAATIGTGATAGATQ